MVWLLAPPPPSSRRNEDVFKQIALLGLAQEIFGVAFTSFCFLVVLISLSCWKPCGVKLLRMEMKARCFFVVWQAPHVEAL